MTLDEHVSLPGERHRILDHMDETVIGFVFLAHG